MRWYLTHIYNTMIYVIIYCKDVYCNAELIVTIVMDCFGVCVLMSLPMTEKSLLDTAYVHVALLWNIVDSSAARLRAVDVQCRCS